MLFRPDFVLDQFSPAWADIELRQYAAGTAKLESDRNMRIHVTRETNYGDRYKLYVIPVPAAGAGPAAIGASFEPISAKPGESRKGEYRLGTLSFTGAAGKAGLKRGDIVTGVSLEQLDRPAKELVYPAGFLILGFVLLLQWRRQRRAG